MYVYGVVFVAAEAGHFLCWRFRTSVFFFYCGHLDLFFEFFFLWCDVHWMMAIQLLFYYGLLGSHVPGVRGISDPRSSTRHTTIGCDDSNEFPSLLRSPPEMTLCNEYAVCSMLHILGPRLNTRGQARASAGGGLPYEHGGVSHCAFCSYWSSQFGFVEYGI